jgi:hypothetical protein
LATARTLGYDSDLLNEKPTRAVEPSTSVSTFLYCTDTLPQLRQTSGYRIDKVVQVKVGKQVGEQLPWEGVLGQL